MTEDISAIKNLLVSFQTEYGEIKVGDKVYVKSTKQIMIVCGIIDDNHYNCKYIFYDYNYTHTVPKDNLIRLKN